MESRVVQVCVPVSERTFAAMKESAKRAAQLGELVELRLDRLDEDQLAIADADLESWLPSLQAPVIVTLRPAEQGGPRSLTRDFRQQFIAKRKKADLIDIELDLATLFASQSTPQIDWAKTICSHHDFAGVPEKLNEKYEQLSKTPARVLKIAVQANDVTDCLAVFRLIERARADGREIIAIAMGPAGLCTRVLGPARGSFLTYGALVPDRATGPGQLTARELNDLFRVRSIDQGTQILGIAGKPVSHSISPWIHNEAFAATGLNAVYLRFDVQDVGAFVRRMIHPASRELDWNFRGLSVTAPHKSTVMDHLDWLSPAAQEIGAVNTIVCEAEELHGYNTDGDALVQPLLERLGRLEAKQCAVIGAGGAARAALWALRRHGAAVKLFARDLEKAKTVAAAFDTPAETLSNATFSNFDVVINATPLGTNGNLSNETPVVATQLRDARVAYDLVYNPVETRFLREARDAGCETLRGLEMLVAQAFEQFKLWTGLEAPRDVMRKAAMKALSNG
jgi:3-dehydroquinate dehydratase / shikimate dehydrogenase